MATLTKSAIKYPDGEIITGRRHGDCIAKQAKFGIYTRESEGCVQGFVDEMGKFYTRDEARELALQNGQIPKDHKGMLYSEDLWKDSLLCEAED